MEAQDQRGRMGPVTVESRITWSTGDQSVYFRDPDGHLIELNRPE